MDALHNDEFTCLSRSDHAAEISAVALEVKPGWCLTVCLRSSFLCLLVGTRQWLLPLQHCSELGTEQLMRAQQCVLQSLTGAVASVPHALIGLFC